MCINHWRRFMDLGIKLIALWRSKIMITNKLYMITFNKICNILSLLNMQWKPLYLAIYICIFYIFTQGGRSGLIIKFENDVFKTQLHGKGSSFGFPAIKTYF